MGGPKMVGSLLYHRTLGVGPKGLELYAMVPKTGPPIPGSLGFLWY